MASSTCASGYMTTSSPRSRYVRRSRRSSRPFDRSMISSSRVLYILDGRQVRTALGLALVQHVDQVEAESSPPTESTREVLPRVQTHRVALLQRQAVAIEEGCRRGEVDVVFAGYGCEWDLQVWSRSQRSLVRFGTMLYPGPNDIGDHLDAGPGDGLVGHVSVEAGALATRRVLPVGGRPRSSSQNPRPARHHLGGRSRRRRASRSDRPPGRRRRHRCCRGRAPPRRPRWWRSRASASAMPNGTRPCRPPEPDVPDRCVCSPRPR